MNFLISIAGIFAWQAALIALYHFGEVDTFWFAVLEVVSFLLSAAMLAFGWVASINWAE